MPDRRDDRRYRRSKFIRRKIDPKKTEEDERALFEAYVKSREYRIYRIFYILPVLLALLLIAEDTIIPKTKVTYTISGKRIGSHRESRKYSTVVVPDNYLEFCGTGISVSGRTYQAAQVGDKAECEYFAITKLRSLFTVHFPEYGEMAIIDSSDYVLSIHGVLIWVILLAPVYVLFVQRDDFMFMLLLTRPGFYLYMSGLVVILVRITFHFEFIPPC